MKKLLTLSLFLLASNFLMLKGQEFNLQDFDGPQPLSLFEIQNLMADPFLNESNLDPVISCNASLFLQEPKAFDYSKWENEQQEEIENITPSIESDFYDSISEDLKKESSLKEIAEAKNAMKALFSHGAHQVNQLQQLNIPKQNNAVKKPRKKQDASSVLIPKVVKDKSLYNKPTPITMYRCPRCLSEETFNKKDIDKHLDSCGLPFKCTLCGSGYLQNGGLRQHLKSKSHGFSEEEALLFTKDL